MEAKTGAAARRQNGGSGFNQGADITGSHRFKHDSSRSRGNYQSDFGMAPLPLQDTGGYSQILKASVGAGADKDLLDFGPLKLPGCAGVIYGMGLGYRGLKIS